MTDVQSNVILTANTSQYDQSMQSASQQTNALATSVDTLSGKIESLAKSAGRKMIGISVADTATITGTVAAYAAWEKQMTGLNTQVDILNKSVTDQRRVFGDYSNQVNSLRRTFGDTTQEAAALVQTISTMSDNTTSADKLTTSFSKLGQATQESSVQLASSMLQLQKTMGTPQRDTEKFNNQLAVLSARSTASASSILDFANSIAPVGRLVNMTQTDIMGFSNAFIKAGQDGYQAANVFNKMLSDIAYSVQSGSPDLAKYANLVGMTTQNFKQLGGTDQYLRIFDAINRQGPRAISTLNQMGLDGMRTVRTVSAMAQQSGGLQAEITAARNADPNAMNRGSAAAMDEIVSSLTRLRAELNQTAEAFGSKFAGPAKIFLGSITAIAGVIRDIVNGPLGTMASVVAGIAAPFAALAGTILLASKALLAFSTARALFGTTWSGFKETKNLSSADRAAMVAADLVPGVGANRSPAGRVGDRVAQRGSWTNRLTYNAGADVGRFLYPSGQVSGTNALSRIAGHLGTAGAWGVNNLITPQFGAGAVRIPGVSGSGGYNDPTRRWRVFNSPTVAGSFGMGAAGWAMKRSGEGFVTRSGVPMTYDDAHLTNAAFDNSAGSKASTAKRLADAEKFAQRTSATARATEDLGKAAINSTKGLGGFAGSLGKLMMMMGANGIGAGRFGIGMAAKGLDALGIPPLLLAGLAGFGVYKGFQAITDTGHATNQDTSGFANPYITAGGGTPPTTATLIGGAKTSAPTVTAASTVSPTDQLAATSSGFKLTNTSIKGLTAAQAVARMAPTMASIKNNPQALQALKLDLVSQYGSQAQNIINQMLASSPTSMDYSSFINPGANPGKEHWYSTSPSQTKAMAQFNNLAGLMGDQQNVAYSTGGTNAAVALRGKQLSTAIGDFARTTAGQSSVQTNSQRIAFNKMIFHNVFGIELTDDEAAHILTPSGNMSNTAALSKYLQGLTTTTTAAVGKGAMSNTQVPGVAISDTQRQNILTKFGLPSYTPTSQFAGSILGMATNPPQVKDTQSLEYRLSKMPSGGVFNLPSVRNVVNGATDAASQFRAAQDMYNRMSGNGLTPAQIQKRMGNAMATIGVDDNPNSQLAQMVQQLNQRTYQAQLPTMSRTGQFGAETNMFQSTMQQNIGTSAANLQARQTAIQNYIQQGEQMREYFQQMLLQQREFDIQRSRAQEDFNLQRAYSEADYQRMRSRAETDFQLQRSREIASFDRMNTRALADFNLSRKRSEEDHQHQVMLMIDQQAKSYYDMYQRVQVQRTSSATWLLVNSQDQTHRIQQQEAQLNALRKQGLSTDAIQQMGLTDTNNAQQLARFVAEVANDPNLIKQFNAQVATRLKAAKGLVTDSSSSDWTQFEYSYHLAANRAQADFTRQMTRSHDDFNLQLSQQNHDFQTSLSRQQQDYAISMNRQEVAFNTTMQRSAADLARSAQTIDGNFTDILTQATTKLSGHAAAQAKAVLSQFANLKSDSSSAAADIMSAIASIFGVNYTPPSSATGNNNVGKLLGNATSGYHMAGSTNVFKASGGVLPGFTPGVDTIHYKSDSGSPDLHLSGGEAIMVPEWTKKMGGAGVVAEMNRRARAGRYAAGGLFQPVQGPLTQGLHDQWTGFPAIDFGVPTGTRVAAGADGTVSKSYDIPGNQNGGYSSYGRVIQILSNGFSTLYAHLSQRGMGVGQHVRGGEIIGLSGNTGNSTGPHLHFGAQGISPLAFLGGSTSYFGGNNLANLSGTAMAAPTLASVIRSLYAKPEADAAKMNVVHPLVAGAISSIINSAATTRWNKLSATAAPVFPGGSNAGGNNQAIVRQAMTQAGWGANEWGALYQLVMSESSFNNTNQNPGSTAYGLFQFLDSTWKGYGPKTSDPVLQSKYGMEYIKNRYGDPINAWNFHQAHNWYGEGAVFQGAQTIGVGERGPEAVIPLNDRGADFIAGLITKYSSGVEARGSNVRGSTPMSCIHNQYSYSIDRSTTFSGAITVAANNPGELISQLQARQRVMALSQPVLAGGRTS